MHKLNAEIVQNYIMLKDSIPFRERLRKIINSYGSNTEVAGLIDVSEKTIRRWLSGDAEPRRPSLARLCDAAEVSYEWLVEGRGEMKPTKSQPPGGTSRVKESGGVTNCKQKTTPLESYLERGFEVWIANDSNMEPTIHEGEICLVEPYKSSLTSGVWLVRLGTVEKAQRVQQLPDGLALSNDNPTYRASDITITELGRYPLEIIGRIHRGGRPL